MAWFDLSNMMGKLRYLFSTIAIFMVLWSVMAIVITAVLSLLPFSTDLILNPSRWGISLIVLILLIKNGNILINK